MALPVDVSNSSAGQRDYRFGETVAFYSGGSWKSTVPYAYTQVTVTTIRYIERVRPMPAEFVCNVTKCVVLMVIGG